MRAHAAPPSVVTCADQDGSEIATERETTDFASIPEWRKGFAHGCSLPDGERGTSTSSWLFLAGRGNAAARPKRMRHTSFDLTETVKPVERVVYGLANRAALRIVRTHGL
jgi:hypothetical protein